MRKNTLQPILDIYIKKGGSKAWTKGSSARDSEGNPVSTLSPRAVSWCLSAALGAWRPYLLEYTIELNRRLRKKDGYFTGIVNFNDRNSTSWDGVVRVLSQKDASLWERIFEDSELEVVGAIVAGLLIGATAGWLLI